MDSVMVPIWLTLRSSALTTLPSMAFWMRLGLVTSMSSPMTWQMPAAVSSFEGSQSSCAQARAGVTALPGNDRSYSLARQDIKLQTENKGTPAQRDPQ